MKPFKRKEDDEEDGGDDVGGLELLMSTKPAKGGEPDGDEMPEAEPAEDDMGGESKDPSALLADVRARLDELESLLG